MSAAQMKEMEGWWWVSDVAASQDDRVEDSQKEFVKGRKQRVMKNSSGGRCGRGRKSGGCGLDER